jgi:hypothetical protein
MPESVWGCPTDGEDLSAQPISEAANSPAETWKTKLYRNDMPIENKRKEAKRSSTTVRAASGFGRSRARFRWR